MYILDTSSIRGISRDRLTAAGTKVDIAVSTLSVLELASHLNDSSDDTAYMRARGHLLKCQIPRMLDDPFVLLSQQNQSSVNPTRKEDKLILSQLMCAVEQSKTLAELKAKTLSYLDGPVASCENIGVNIAEILKEEEDHFVSHVESLASRAKLDPSMNGKHILSSEVLFRHLTVASQSLSVEDNKSGDAATFLTAAPYFGYLLHRLYYYANCRSPGKVELFIDRNDCEDAYISLSLDLNTSDTIVTNDGGTLAALRSTIALLNERLPVPISACRVMSNEEFLCAVESI